MAPCHRRSLRRSCHSNDAGANGVRFFGVQAALPPGCGGKASPFRQAVKAFTFLYFSCCPVGTERQNLSATAGRQSRFSRFFRQALPAPPQRRPSELLKTL